MDVNEYIDQMGEGSNLESLENLEMTTEHFVRLGMPLSQARAKAIEATKGSAINRAVTGAGADKYNASAQFSIKIVRNSANIAEILPVPLFGAIDLQGKYAQSLGGYMPAGVSLESVANINGVLRFTYTDGTDTDTIDITCSQIAYASFVYSTLTDVMSIRAIRYKINSDAQLSNFSNQFTIVKKSLFGKKDSDDINVTSYQDPTQFLKDVIDIGDVRNVASVVTSVDKETSIVVGMNAGAFSIELSTFVAKFNKLNATSRL